MRLSRATAGLVLAAALAAWSPPASARDDDDAPRCEAVRLRVDPGLGPRWRSAASALRAELETLRPPECAEVAIDLDPDAAGAAVRARASDGREAKRTLRDPRGLVPVVLGLLAVAPANVEGEGSDADATDGVPAGPAPDDPLDLPPADEHPRILRVERPRELGLAMGVATGARAGLPTEVAMADLEVHADVLVRDWILGAGLRYAPFAASPRFTPGDGDTYEETAIALGVGRRLHAGRSGFDLMLVPSVAFVSIESNGPVGADTGRDHAQWRLGGAGRWSYPFARGWRFTTTLDSELAPGALAHHHASYTVAPFPAWTLGLRIGAMADLL